MSTHVYVVTTARFGDLRLAADSAALARDRVARMFPGERCAVRRERSGKRCGRCDSAPCCCPPRMRTPAR